MLNHNNMPGAGSIADTMEFMRKMWGSMGAPAMGIPSLSVEEINKKISDLKTVASWLELNMNMLRATIQTLEVQSATLSTLQAMGAILTPRDADDAAAAAKAASPFGFPNWPPQATEPQKEDKKETPRSASAPQPEPAVEDEEDEESADEDMPEDLSAKGKDAAAEAEAGQNPMPAPDFQASMANPNAWWNLLQEQFQQAVGNVLADQVPAGKEATKSKPATKPAGKPARKAASASAGPKKTTKPKAEAKPRTRAKSTVVQSRQSKPASRKPKSP
ncbi:pilus assembly protein FimV [Herbaspirillum sp. meg3]|uniref:PhaM family polyhydroxyalkanoate granule multifunctional regulatory protein n=1 Tax=Herbaspirillum sp. meg3 TaxID=2025949 RepID=UPI000B991B06|nr:PhaM family polyhydroxyalkanoate granule multifunctional regulatory protein [Herbaspirillum sp. meg3]ASU37403.1 pilus assembly protein FimV [Herbaspirillum sp. meg3]